MKTGMEFVKKWHAEADRLWKDGRPAASKGKRDCADELQAWLREAGVALDGAERSRGTVLLAWVRIKLLGTNAEPTEAPYNAGGEVMLLQISRAPTRWWRRVHKISITVWPNWLAQRLCNHNGKLRHVGTAYKDNVPLHDLNTCSGCYAYLKTPLTQAPKGSS